MKLPSCVLRNLSNEDSRTDLIEWMLIASVLTLGVVATCATVTIRICLAFNTIASRL